MVTEKPHAPMLLEVTTNLTHMVEGWTSWMSKEGDWTGEYPEGYLKANRVKFKPPVFFTLLKIPPFDGL
jgi:hypothetical protein